MKGNKKTFCGRVIILSLCWLFLTSYRPPMKKAFGVRTVVIDAGHGGYDFGCLGSNAKEKNIALAISLKLGELIEKTYPDVRVVFTRKTDVFVELHERAGIANRAKADLFICIHCNSACVRERSGKETCNEATHGPETYVMGLHKTDENLNVSRRENASVLYEKDYKTKYDGFDPNSAEANIIFTLFQNAFMSQSISFASKIQNEFEEYAGRKNRGVKQAGFLVLYRTTMPSVLVETGFLTNNSEEKYLLSEKGQGEVATSIFRAFKEYKIDLESDSPSSIENKLPEEKPDDTIKNAPKETKKEDVAETKVKTADTVKASLPDAKPIPVVVKKDSVQKSTGANTTTSSTVPVKTNPVKDIKETKNVAPDDKAIYFTVQLGATKTGATSGVERFVKMEGIRKIDGEDGMTRYTIGKFPSLNEAITLQGEMRTKGFKDAFVTAYNNSKRISLKEAGDLLKKK